MRPEILESERKLSEGREKEEKADKHIILLRGFLGERYLAKTEEDTIKRMENRSARDAIKIPDRPPVNKDKIK